MARSESQVRAFVDALRADGRGDSQAWVIGKYSSGGAQLRGYIYVSSESEGLSKAQGFARKKGSLEPGDYFLVKHIEFTAGQRGEKVLAQHKVTG